MAKKRKAGSVVFVTVKMRGGKTRKQKAIVQKNGRFKFVKN